MNALSGSPPAVSAGPAETITTVRVWDLPTRLFHWALAGCVAASLASAWLGGNAMAWHFRLGYAAFALLAFRLVWGLVGGHWSRFATFVRGPAAVARYLRGASRADEHPDLGHNPLGAVSVLGLLAVLAAQVATGLFADDEIASNGPLVKFVSGATSLALTRWHHGWGQWLILGLVALHFAAILYYRIVRRRDLVRPMFSGDMRIAVAEVAIAAPAPASVDNTRTRLVAAVLLALCAGGVAWLVAWAG